MPTKYAQEEMWNDSAGQDETASVGDDNDPVGDDNDSALAFLLLLFGAPSGLVKVVQWWDSQAGKVKKGATSAVVAGKTYITGKVRR